MNKIARQLLAAFCCFVLVTGLAVSIFAAPDTSLNRSQAESEAAGQFKINGNSAEAGPVFDDVILSGVFTDVTIEKTNGTTEGIFNSNEIVDIRMNFYLDRVQPGDFTVITLPDELLVVSTPDFTLTNSSGNLPIATASINATANTITITFNDNVEGLQNIRGQLIYTAQLNNEAFNDDGIYTLIFKENDIETCSVNLNIKKYVPGGGTFLDVMKYGSVNPDGTVTWEIFVNFPRSSLTNAVISDVLGSGHSIVEGSVQVIHLANLTIDQERYTYQYSSKNDITSEVSIETKADGFSVSLGDTSEGYFIYVTSKVDDPSVKTYGNIVYLSADEWPNPAYHWNTVYLNYGGSAVGDMTGKLKIVKLDADSGKPLSGAQFDLVTEESDFIKDLVSNEEGVATIEALEVGAVYYLVETKAPEGYVLNTNRIRIEITGSEVLEIKVENKAADVPKGSIFIIKIDDEDESILISGAEFALWLDSEGSEQFMDQAGSSTWQTVDGYATIQDVPYGDYFLVEVGAAENYSLLQDPIPISVNGENLGYAQVMITNQRLTVPVGIHKVNEKSEPLPGAEFRLEKNLPDGSDNWTEVGAFTSDSDGIYALTLSDGNYRIWEVTAPQGYKQLEDWVYFNITQEQTTLDEPVNITVINTAIASITNPPVSPKEQPANPVNPPTEPTDPPEEPTDPPEEPTGPSAKPTEPPAEPTEPPIEPTGPSAKPTDPATEPTGPHEEAGIPKTGLYTPLPWLVFGFLVSLAVTVLLVLYRKNNRHRDE